jgi:hypothetical protein
MSQVNDTTTTMRQHADVTWRASGRVSAPFLPVLTEDRCVTDRQAPVAYDTAVQTSVLGHPAVLGMSINGAFAGTRSWSPPS